MKLECDLWEIFVLVCFFFFWRPGDHAKTLCSVPHIHFRRHWNQSIILVNLDVKNGPKNIVFILGFVHTILDSFFFSQRHNRFCVWTEALSAMIFVAAEKLSSTVAYLWAYKIQKSCVCYILCSVSVWSDLGWFCDLFVTCTLFIITGYTYFWQARRM